MITKLEEEKRISLYHILCILAGVVALFPVSVNYILSGGIVTEWIARVEELATGFRTGQLLLFPSAETIINTGIKVNGMNSNLWFFIPGVIYGVSGNMTLCYRLYMLAVQAGTWYAALLMFGRLFSNRESKLPVFFGVLLYMTCPYRIYICYDYANLSQMTAWMLVPLYVWAAVGVMEGQEKQKLQNAAVAALALAGTGYADVTVFLIVACVTVLAGLVRRQWYFLAVSVAGGIIFLPGLYRLIRYLFLDGYQELDMPLMSIMANGYRGGEFFSSYAFRSGHPGMGLGMLICLLVGGWMAFVENKKASGVCRAFGGMSVIFVLLSMTFFPWDFVQRLGTWSLKLVSLIGTPAIFWGMALFSFCVPAACSVNRISKHENKMAAYAVPLIIMVACLWICIYQCNTLTYNRLPLANSVI